MIFLDILWICLMTIMCFADIYMLCLGWNTLALIGLIFCGISLINTLFKVFKTINKLPIWQRRKCYDKK